MAAHQMKGRNRKLTELLAIVPLQIFGQIPNPRSLANAPQRHVDGKSPIFRLGQASLGKQLIKFCRRFCQGLHITLRPQPYNPRPPRIRKCPSSNDLYLTASSPRSHLSADSYYLRHVGLPHVANEFQGYMHVFRLNPFYHATSDASQVPLHFLCPPLQLVREESRKE